MSIVERIKVRPFEAVVPFAGSMPSPEPDESLLGFVTRAFSLTAVSRTVTGLALGGIAKLDPCRLPTTLVDGREIEGLARLLKTTPEEVRRRTYQVGTFDHSSSETVNFFGTRIRADYREKRTRRVAPRALEKSPYHRAMWELRVFSFDPDTFEYLIDSCPNCSAKLGWRNPRGITKCENCVGEDGLPTVDLRDFPQPLVELEDTEALCFVANLVHPNPARKALARRALNEPWSEFSNDILFETVIAFACALTMLPTKARTTLERPKEVHEYARFTPDLLAKAARGIIGGEAGFTVIADQVRSDASARPGFYGVKKELGPLFCMTVDQHLPRAIKDILKEAIARDMARTKSSGALRRADYAGDERFLPLDSIAQETGLPRMMLGWLADSGLVTVRQSQDAKQSPKLMLIAEIEPLVEQYRDAMHQKFAAGALWMRQEDLPSMADLGLIERLDGPVLGLMGTSDAYYRKSSVERLASKIWAKAKAGGTTPPPPHGMRISKAVKRLGMTPIPWPSVIAAIVGGKADVRIHPGDGNVNWLTGIGVADVSAFVRAVLSEIGSAAPNTLDEWIGNQVSAEILGVNQTLLFRLIKAGKVIPRGTNPHKKFRRDEIEALAREFVFVAEIHRRVGLPRTRDVRSWLEDRGVQPAFQLEEKGSLGYRRVEVEPLIPT